MSDTDGLFIVDVEATSATPETGVMTEFGVVEVSTFERFHGHLWDFHPDPKVPARPVADRLNPGFTTNKSRIRASLETEEQVLRILTDWLKDRHGGRAVLVSDNPAFDFMWMACAFDRHGLVNPFGFSGRRIGDFAAGIEGNWKRSNQWKSLRLTDHDHNPVNDALGNAEALRELIKMANVKTGE